MEKRNMFTTKKFGDKTWLFCMSGSRNSVDKKAHQMRAYKTKVLKSDNEWDLWISRN